MPQDLDALLDAWRRTRAPELADAIDRVPLNEKPLTAKAAWWKAHAAGKSVNFGALLEGASLGLDRAERVHALAKLPADPRTTAAATKWLTDGSIRGKWRAPFFDGVAALLSKAKDPRLLPVLTKLLADRNEAITVVGLSNYKAFVELAALLSKTKSKPLDKAMQKLLAGSPSPKSTAGDAAALFAQVYANPDDDAARAVLADLLTEQGDPRGEFITLQLAGKKTAQEAKLEKTWDRKWLGAIESAAMKTGVVFERGFPSRIRCAYPKYVNPTIDAPEWSTVTSVDVSNLIDQGGEAKFLASLKNLREVTGLSSCEGMKKLPWPSVELKERYWEALFENIAAHIKDYSAVKQLTVSTADGSPLDGATADIFRFLKLFPPLDDVTLNFVAAEFKDLVKHPECKRLRKLVVIDPGKTHTWNNPARGRRS